MRPKIHCMDRLIIKWKMNDLSKKYTWEVLNDYDMCISINIPIDGFEEEINRISDGESLGKLVHKMELPELLEFGVEMNKLLNHHNFYMYIG